MGGGGGGGGSAGHASGGVGGGSSKSGGNSATACRSGKVLDQRTHKCAYPRQGMIDDDSLYQAGRALAMAGRYGEAITVLGYIVNKEDPAVLNYLGYAHRKSGRIQVGLGYYEEALRINPDYTLAREYLGEAYLTLGDVASAKNQLDEIDKRCGKGCREYGLLADQIANVKI
jgi:tetratricopeptide (TPR) repeat protein